MTHGASAAVSPAPPGLSRRPVRVSHTLGGDPRLARCAVAELASTASASDIEHHIASLPVVLPSGEAPQLELTPRQVVTGIEDNNCWIGVFHLERKEPYRRLLHDCLAGWTAYFEAEGGRVSPTANVFLASPHSVTPVHVDRVHNLLLQIEGTKEVIVGTFDSRDDEVAEVNRHFDAEQSNFSTLPPRTTSWVIGPGEGLYLPPYAPHWVRTGDEVTLSLSCVVHTPASRRLELAHICNARLRRMGLHPAPAGTSHRVDTTKAMVVSVGRRARQSKTIRAAHHVIKALLTSSKAHMQRGDRPRSSTEAGDATPGEGE